MMPASLHDSVAADFPLLAASGRSLVYLDSAVTAQKPQRVIDAMTDYYTRHCASVHRSQYPLAERATELFEGARDRVAAFCGCDPRETVFTRNATEAINLVAVGWGGARLGPGDQVLVTVLEHHSNFVPWQVVCARNGAELVVVDVDDEGTVDIDSLRSHLAGGRVRLVAIAHVSNVLGTVVPVEDIVAAAHAAGALTLVDGSQAVPHMPVNLGDLGVDFYAWTGHKALGPTGVGVLHARSELLEQLEPLVTGGHMIASVELAASTWAEPPGRFEAGTSDVGAAIGLGAAVDYLSELGMSAVRNHEVALASEAHRGLQELGGVVVHGPGSGVVRGPIVSFSVEGVHPHDVAEILQREGICIRAGHHCAQPLMARLGVPATARASFGPYSSSHDVRRLIDGVRHARAIFEDV